MVQLPSEQLGPIVLHGVNTVGGTLAVLVSYQAKMSVVMHWKKRKMHWTKTYHSMVETSVPLKYQKICGCGGVGRRGEREGRRGGRRGGEGGGWRGGRRGGEGEGGERGVEREKEGRRGWKEGRNRRGRGGGGGGKEKEVRERGIGVSKERHYMRTLPYCLTSVLCQLLSIILVYTHHTPYMLHHTHTNHNSLHQIPQPKHADTLTMAHT